VKTLLYSLLLLVLVAVAFFAGRSLPTQSPEPIHASATKALFEDDDEDSVDPAAGAVRIGAERQQVIGLRVETVKRSTAVQSMRVLGRVAVDETRIYRLIAAVDGWIQDVPPLSAGSLVKKNELLASFYSPEFLSAQQAYIFALGSLSRFKASQKEPPEQINLTKLNVTQYEDTLRNLGMGELQIKEIAKTRTYTENIRVAAPVGGFILSRNISPGQRFDKGYEWYRLADLSHIWILTDTFEREAKYLQAGKRVTVTHPGIGASLEARVSGTLPQFDAVSRTLKVRLEAANHDYLLKPDMFVDVEIPVEHPAAIYVPADAVLDSGLRQTVFVLRGKGLFEPREVTVGRRAGGRVEITEGLEEGEQIVVSGNFLVDSESKLQLAASVMQSLLAKDPVCGREISPRKAEKDRRRVRHAGGVYYFCSDEHKRQFETNPGAYVRPSN
jgi:RND family efflux transporter MFP subunit